MKLFSGRLSVRTISAPWKNSYVIEGSANGKPIARFSRADLGMSPDINVAITDHELRHALAILKNLVKHGIVDTSLVHPQVIRKRRSK